MITADEVLGIHQILIERFGGTSGLRNRELLESALARPFQTFDGQDLYPNPEDKAAAIVESLVINHPFLDGNKRIGYVLMRDDPPRARSRHASFERREIRIDH